MAKEKNQNDSLEKSGESPETVSDKQPELLKMVQVRFIANGTYYIPGENGIPQPNFYKKHEIVLVKKSLADAFKEQGLQFETYAAA